MDDLETDIGQAHNTIIFINRDLKITYFLDKVILFFKLLYDHFTVLLDILMAICNENGFIILN